MTQQMADYNTDNKMTDTYTITPIQLYYYKVSTAGLRCYTCMFLIKPSILFWKIVDPL